MGEDLKQLRNELDALDKQMLDALKKRFYLVRYIGVTKQKDSKYDPTREQEVLEKWLHHTSKSDLDPDFIRELHGFVMEASKKMQRDIMDE